jgi:hypothetical protein
MSVVGGIANRDKNLATATVGARKRSAQPCLAAMALTCAVVLLSVSAAGAQIDPAGELLTGLPLRGYVVAPPGPQNGPVNQSNLPLLGDSSGAFAQALTSPDVTAALRVWTDKPANGPSNGTTIVVSDVELANTSQAMSFIAAAGRSQRGSKVSRFPVSVGHGQAFGQESTVLVNGAAVNTYAFYFSVANIAFVVTAVATTAAFTPADASKVSAAQYALAATDFAGGGVISLGGGGSTIDARKVGFIVGVALIAVLILGVIVALIRRQNTHVWRAPPELAGPLEAGWHPAPEGTGQAYWDGQAWTGRRFWTGSGWAEL